MKKKIEVFMSEMVHNMLDLHQPDGSRKLYDGCAVYSKCRWCGKEIVMNEEGNWVLTGEVESVED